jgi:hypothetical protein
MKDETLKYVVLLMSIVTVPTRAEMRRAKLILKLALGVLLILYYLFVHKLV